MHAVHNTEILKSVVDPNDRIISNKPEITMIKFRVIYFRFTLRCNLKKTSSTRGEISTIIIKANQLEMCLIKINTLLFCLGNKPLSVNTLKINITADTSMISRRKREIKVFNFSLKGASDRISAKGDLRKFQNDKKIFFNWLTFW